MANRKKIIIIALIVLSFLFLVFYFYTINNYPSKSTKQELKDRAYSLTGMVVKIKESSLDIERDGKVYTVLVDDNTLITAKKINSDPRLSKENSVEEIGFSDIEKGDKITASSENNIIDQDVFMAKRLLKIMIEQ